MAELSSASEDSENEGIRIKNISDCVKERNATIIEGMGPVPSYGTFPYKRGRRRDKYVERSTRGFSDKRILLTEKHGYIQEKAHNSTEVPGHRSVTDLVSSVGLPFDFEDEIRDLIQNDK
eukprot:CAMPEP_0114490608 /NCGR_PEP_ID=MMETSP0109-20121206/2537_1 /TAXON_ID=29199 /ORGANISM="Chlorarachnion reptans, Strain CCCM449" /LENGTH=119 /DNA_ID=CAMNT_0001667245 /DNA_START=316 /DNA_END=675 /DNA_ORIENTATION=+